MWVLLASGDLPEGSPGPSRPFGSVHSGLSGPHLSSHFVSFVVSRRPFVFSQVVCYNHARAGGAIMVYPNQAKKVLLVYMHQYGLFSPHSGGHNTLY